MVVFLCSAQAVYQLWMALSGMLWNDRFSVGASKSKRLFVVQCNSSTVELSTSEGNGKPGLGSWNKEVRVNSHLYRVREIVVAAVCNWVARAPSALTLFVLMGMCQGTEVHLGACLYSSLPANVVHVQMSRKLLLVFVQGWSLQVRLYDLSHHATHTASCFAFFLSGLILKVDGDEFLGLSSRIPYQCDPSHFTCRTASSSASDSPG